MIAASASITGACRAKLEGSPKKQGNIHLSCTESIHGPGRLKYSNRDFDQLAPTSSMTGGTCSSQASHKVDTSEQTSNLKGAICEG